MNLCFSVFFIVPLPCIFMPLNIHDTFSLTHVGVCVSVKCFFCFVFVCCLCVDVICAVLCVLVPVYSTVCAFNVKACVCVCSFCVCMGICICVCDVFLSRSPAYRLSALTVCVTNGRSRCSSQFWRSLEGPMAPTVAAWAGGTRLSLPAWKVPWAQQPLEDPSLNPPLSAP